VAAAAVPELLGVAAKALTVLSALCGKAKVQVPYQEHIQVQIVRT
jgi:hypothetical protein